MRSFVVALRFLTLFPWPGKPLLSHEIGRSSPFFPVVGFFVGLILVLLNRLLEPYLESEILGIVLVAVLVVVTRAQHLQGLKVTFDEISFRVRREGGKSGAPEVFGFLAVAVAFLLESRAIEVMGEVRSQGLLLAPVLGFWSVVILEQKIAAVLDRVRGVHLFWATAMTLPLVIGFSGGVGLWITLWVSLLTLAAGSYLRRRQGGVTGDSFGAVAELSEALAMVLYASLY
ncbi:MAG: adenosylcobinamide-GDP ribazoletransferase [Deltaproteobacteria bacterium]|nr:adenosylcobinamide-GDP ribazoletransferase [Deltaproteobacteria bacterium]